MGKNKRKRTLWTTETFSDYVTSQTNGEYVLRSEYEKATKKVMIEHVSCGTVWGVTPNSFINGTRCTNCFGNKRKTTEDFKKEVFEMYGDEYIVLGEYVASSKKIKMRHNCGYEYDVTPSNFLKKRKCPRCSRKVADETNCLATTHPHLVKEWNFEKNGDKTPYNILSGHSKKVWWICEHGHEWEAKPHHRTSTNETGCPYCNGSRKTKYEDSLEFLKPSVAKEWDYEKNGDLKPSEVGNFSSLECHWKCENGHQWQQKIVVRTRNGGEAGCPYCNKRKLSEDNNLQVTHPEIAKRWHPTKNGDLKPTDVRRHSTIEVWWICEHGHEHKTKVSYKQDSCPICTSQYLHIDNCLATVNPELAKEWHPTKNGELTPYDVTGFSPRKVWWKCSECGHEWDALVSNRGRGRGCPNCRLFKSKGAKNIAKYLDDRNVVYEDEYTFQNCKNECLLRFDFAVFEENGDLACLIEFDGEQHYYPVQAFGGEEGFKKTKQNDEIKTNYCINNNIPLIRIPYWLRDYVDVVLDHFLIPLLEEE